VTLLRLLRAISSDVRGTALIEGAIALPLLFVLFFGVFEFSWYFYEQHRVSIGIRDAARYIARSENLDWSTSPATIPDPVRHCAQLLAVTGDITFVSGQCPLLTSSRVAGWTASDVQIPTQASSVACTCQGGAMQVVTVSTSFQSISLGLLGFLGMSPFAINISHTERILNGS
jgi:Flp pilus assembly protein TadG